MEKPKHERIWLRPDMWDGEKIWCWCEDIAPFIGDEPDEADGPYIHVDALRKKVREWRQKAADGNVGGFYYCANELEQMTRGE